MSHLVVIHAYDYCVIQCDDKQYYICSLAKKDRAVLRKMPNIGLHYPMKTKLEAAKVLLCGIDPCDHLAAFSTALDFVVHNDPNVWIRMRGHAVQSKLRGLGTTRIPKSVSQSNRERYMSISTLVPREYVDKALGIQQCLQIKPPHSFLILLCVYYSDYNIPKELGVMILNYL